MKKERSEKELLMAINKKLDKLILVVAMGNTNDLGRKIIAKNSKFSKREIEKLTGFDRKKI